jgi:hypothetical protein
MRPALTEVTAVTTTCPAALSHCGLTRKQGQGNDDQAYNRFALSHDDAYRLQVDSV